MGIIFTTVGIVMAFIFLFIVAIVLIVNKVRKKTTFKRDLTLVIIAGVLFFGLIGLDLNLIRNAVIVNEANIEQAADEAARVAGKGLVISYDAIKSQWNTRSEEKLKNVDITVKNYTIKELKKTKNVQYTFNVLINNKNKKDESMPLSEMLSFDYIFMYDEDEIFHKIDSYESESEFLPVGKSLATFTAYVANDVDIVGLELVDRKIPLKK